MSAKLRNFTIWSIIALLTLVVTQVLFTLWMNPGQRSVSESIAFSRLLNDVDQGKVREVVIQIQEIRGTYRDGRGFYAYPPDDPALMQRLYGKDIIVTTRQLPDRIPFWFILLSGTWLPFIALIGVWIFLARWIRGTGGKAPGFGNGGTTDNPKH